MRSQSCGPVKLTDSYPTSDQEIETALRRPWWRLAFPPSLERQFNINTGPERCRRLIVYGLVALALYDLFQAVDARLIPDVFFDSLVVRMGVVTPLSLAIVFVLRRNPPVMLREGMEAAITVVVTASAVWFMLISHEPLRAYLHYGILLIIVFANVVQRIRFWYAVVASLASLIIYAAGVSAVSEIAPAAQLSAISILGSAVLLTLMASHSLERDTRRDYLLSLRDRMHRDRLEEMSRHDPLTGLANRRALDDGLAGLWAEADKRDKSIAMLMIDIDEFKLFNDCYGHLAGDTCLKRVSAIVAAELRGPADMAARFGGEELLVVLVDMELPDAVRVAERMRRAIEAVAVPHEGSKPGVVTVSAGAAAGRPDGNIGSAELIAAADAALYAAKHAGRNQVWPPLASIGPREVVHLPLARGAHRGKAVSARD